MNSIFSISLLILFTWLITVIIQLVARRYTTMPGSGSVGLYLLMLPLGFSVTGTDYPSWGPGLCNLLGVTLLLWSLRRHRRDA